MKQNKKINQPNLEEVLKEIKNQFGQGSIMCLGEKNSIDMEVISSGSILLDEALGVGGYPKGRIIEIYGPESSGKTTLALTAVAEVQKAGGRCAYIDVENTIDPDYSERIGIKIDELVLSQPDCGEEAFEILYKTDVMTEVAWGYIYRKDFFMENNFKFAKGLYHEDFGLIPLIMLKAKKVASSNVGKYFYVQTEKSITRGDDSKKLQRAQDLLKHYDNMIKEVENFDISEKSKENIKIYYTNCIILEVANLQGQAQKDYIKEIKKRKMTKNIKARNIKQFIKKVILNISIKLYLKLR